LPELARGHCRDCGGPVYWLVTRNDRLIPVEPSTVQDVDDLASAPSPNREGQMLYVFAFARGHRAHFDYCPAYEEEPATPPPPRQPPDDLFTRRAGASPAHLYAELHLLPGAPGEVVRAAYRALCMIHHPDRNGGEGNDKLQRLNVAYEKIMESL
jgi:hypothetical protein